MQLAIARSEVTKREQRCAISVALHSLFITDQLSSRNLSMARKYTDLAERVKAMHHMRRRVPRIRPSFNGFPKGLLNDPLSLC